MLAAGSSSGVAAAFAARQRQRTVVGAIVCRKFSSDRRKIDAPPMVYIKGEEMSAYTMSLIMDKWVKPFVNTDKWEFYDLSCQARDASDDKQLHDAVEAGKRLGAIFKEPTITPSTLQVQEMGLKKAWGSPNGAMRRGWNGVTISRDTIHIDGIKFGYDKPVFFERHAVGGEYGAGWKEVGKGRLLTTFIPDDVTVPPTVVDARTLTDEVNVAVVYHNPYDNVPDLADIFFSRCLKAGIVPYVVTKKTVFKWQEKFWQMMKERFDADWKAKFIEAGLLDGCGNELQHLISDAATMQIIRWTNGGWGMAAHNYDGDMLTDEISQVHRSPGFITSNLAGVREDGVAIKEFEASHGTVADMWHAHLEGKETSMNPCGMVEALIGAMNHAADLDTTNREAINRYTEAMKTAMYHAFQTGCGTRDLAKDGLTTEKFVEAVAERMELILSGKGLSSTAPALEQYVDPKIDVEKVEAMFTEYDTNGDGSICFSEFLSMIAKLGVAPKK